MNIPGTSGVTQQRLLLIAVGIAAVLRLHHLTGFSLSNDELSALARLRFDSLSTLIEHGVRPDFHPAGVQVFLWLWTGLFGITEWAVRIPFALMGIGSVYLVYRIGNNWFGPSTGLLAAGAMASLGFPLLYSQIARPYSPGLFFSLMAVWFWTQSLFPAADRHKGFRGKWIHFAGFALSVSACMYIHYFSFIFAGLLCFTGLFFLKRDTWLPYLAAGAAVALLYLPHLGVFLHQLAKGGVGGAEGWLGPPGQDAFGKYISYCFNDSEKLKLIYFIICTGTWLIYRKQVTYTRYHLVAPVFFIIPFAVAYYYSIWKNPVFQHSVLLFSFPFLLLLLFSFIPRQAFGRTTVLLYFILIAGTVYSTVVEQKYYKTAHFSEFREVARKMSAISRSLGSQHITVATNVFDPYYLNYYFDQFGDTLPVAISSVMEEQQIRAFSRLLAESATPYFLFAFSNTYDDPATDLLTRTWYPWVVERDTFLNSGLRLYGRFRSDSAVNMLPSRKLENGFETGQWTDESGYRDTSVCRTGKTCLRLKPDQEFSPGLQMISGEYGIEPGARIDLTTWFMDSDTTAGAKLVLSVERNGKTLMWSGSSASKYVYAPGVWCPVVLSARMPQDILSSDLISIYIWNEKREDFRMDDFRMEIYLARR